MSEVDVVTSALRAEASVWEDAADAIGHVAVAAETLRLSHVAAGVFQLIVGAHESVVSVVASRCQEGAEEMDRIAAALRGNAQAYDDGDAAVADRVQGLY